MGLVDLRGQMARKSPEQMVKQLREFSLELKFSAGVWYFAPSGGRFHDRYVPALGMEQILEQAAGLREYGLVGLEAHYPDEVNEQTLPLFQALEREVGIRLITVVPNLFYEAQFEFGSLSSPLPAVRAAAIRRTVEALQINRELGTDFAIVWPGIDGYENPLAWTWWRPATGLPTPWRRPWTRCRGCGWRRSPSHMSPGATSCTAPRPREC